MHLQIPAHIGSGCQCLRRLLSLQHTDLHPGNILVRLRQNGSGEEGKAATVTNIDDVLLRPIAKGQARAQLQLVRPIMRLLQESQHCFAACLENAAGLYDLHSKRLECRCRADPHKQPAGSALHHPHAHWKVSIGQSGPCLQ